MPLTTLGDLAQNYVQRTSISRLNRDLATLGQELSTGTRADVTRAMRGDTQSLAAVDRALAALDAHDLAARETSLIIDATEHSIGQSRQRLGGLLDQMASVIEEANPAQLAAITTTARQHFEAMLSDLNTEVAGIRLFAGTASDGQAVRPGSAILADLAASVSGLSTAADLTAAIDAYFAPGGGFEATDYLGATRSRAAQKIGPNDTVEFAPRADDPAFRDSLKLLARFAVLDMGALAGDDAARSEVLVSSRDDLFNADRALIELQARAGVAQGRVEQVQTRNAAERDGLTRARLDFVAADPFETATRLQETQVQLESLYAVTARLSKLNLTSYL